MSLPGRAADIALAGTLPALALEIWLRVAKQVAIERILAARERRIRAARWASLASERSAAS